MLPGIILTLFVHGIPPILAVTLTSWRGDFTISLQLVNGNANANLADVTAGILSYVLCLVALNLLYSILSKIYVIFLSVLDVQLPNTREGTKGETFFSRLFPTPTHGLFGSHGICLIRRQFGDPASDSSLLLRRERHPKDLAQGLQSLCLGIARANQARLPAQILLNIPVH